MGLGKTIQSIGLMLASKPPKDGPRTTLIVAPLSLKEQWAAEIKAKTVFGALKVTTHHGAKRTTNPAALERYDVVVTTYDVVTSEFPVCPSRISI